MRAVGIEAVRAHPIRYLSGVATTTFEELWKPLFVALPNTGGGAPSGTPSSDDASSPSRAPALPVPTDGEVIPSAHQGFFSTTPDGHIREQWTSPVDHSLVFATHEMQLRYDEMARDAGVLLAEVPPYAGNEWLTLQFSRSSKLFPPLVLWIVAGLAGLGACDDRTDRVSHSRSRRRQRSSSSFRRSRSTRSSSSPSRSRRPSSSSATAGLVGTRTLTESATSRLTSA